LEKKLLSRAIAMTRLIRAAAISGLPVAPAALAAAFCVILSACSPGVDYPSSPFPAAPPPRSDTPLDATQVQQATEDLITARDRLSSEAQSGQTKKPAKPLTTSANAVATKKPAAASPPAGAPARQTAGAEDAQGANAESK
jgi:hypothetical protein